MEVKGRVLMSDCMVLMGVGQLAVWPISVIRHLQLAP